jgi:outer membrane phospholipase A
VEIGFFLKTKNRQWIYVLIEQVQKEEIKLAILFLLVFIQKLECTLNDLTSENSKIYGAQKKKWQINNHQMDRVDCMCM